MNGIGIYLFMFSSISKFFLVQISKSKTAMKRWQVVYALPLEVWVEIFGFPWISREEFGRLVDRIGNFKFTEHAQFFLHEWGKHKLGRLSIDKVLLIIDN